MYVPAYCWDATKMEWVVAGRAAFLAGSIEKSADELLIY